MTFNYNFWMSMQLTELLHIFKYLSLRNYTRWENVNWISCAYVLAAGNCLYV